MLPACKMGQKIMMTKEELKDAIMYQFEKQNLKENEIIPMRYWNFTFIPNLNPKEQDIFEESVNELIDEGKLLYEPDGLSCLRLTKLGMRLLYQNSKSAQDIEDDIMDFFRRGNYRAGQGFMVRNLGSYIQSLNPNEKSLVDIAIENLINKQFIRINEQQDFLFLEDAGYNYIY